MLMKPLVTNHADDLEQRVVELEARERELLQIISSLRKSDNLKLEILDAISALVVYQDVEQNVLWVNKVVAEALRRPQDEVTGVPCRELWFGEQGSCPDCPVAKAMQDSAPREGEIVTRDERIWLVKAFPTFNDAGEVVGCVEIAQDVTRRKQHEQALEDARRRAEDADRVKSEFLANMSHELRTPMNGILGMLDLLRDTPLDEEQMDYVLTALGAGEGLLELINDLLSFSKLQAEMIEVAYADFDVRRTIKAVLDTFTDQCRKKQLVVESRIRFCLIWWATPSSTRSRAVCRSKRPWNGT